MVVGSRSGQTRRSSYQGRAALRVAILSIESLEQRSLLNAHGFVNGLYQELLHRSPAPAEVELWVHGLNAGVSRDQTAQAFTTSPEYRSHEIRNGYHDLLEREPEAGAVEAWLARMQAGMTPEQVSAAVMNSDEYFAKHGSNARGWVEGVYHDVLERAGDEEGVRAWMQTLEQGHSRAEVATRFIESTEAHHGEVQDAYRALLGREPDDVGEHQWVNALNQGMSHEDLLERMVSTGEYDDDHHGGSDPGDDHPD